MSCMNRNNNSITWYEKETIRSIDRIDENTYKIEIGISAQVFYLDKNSNNSKSIYKVLNYSLENKKNIKIGIENNTNKILFAYKLNVK
jgi:hypothetical protein